MSWNVATQMNVDEITKPGKIIVSFNNGYDERVEFKSDIISDGNLLKLRNGDPEALETLDRDEDANLPRIVVDGGASMYVITIAESSFMFCPSEPPEEVFNPPLEDPCERSSKSVGVSGS